MNSRYGDDVQQQVGPFDAHTFFSLHPNRAAAILLPFYVDPELCVLQAAALAVVSGKLREAVTAHDVEECAREGLRRIRAGERSREDLDKACRLILDLVEEFAETAAQAAESN